MEGLNSIIKCITFNSEQILEMKKTQERIWNALSELSETQGKIWNALTNHAERILYLMDTIREKENGK